MSEHGEIDDPGRDPAGLNPPRNLFGGTGTDTGQGEAKGAGNVAVAKDFMRYLIQPQVVNGYLKDGLGRWLPAMPELAKTDPFWLAGNDKHREAYTREGVLGPTVPSYTCYNPGYAEVEAAQLWGMAHADVIREGKTPQAAADKALKRIGEILAKYPVGQA